MSIFIFGSENDIHAYQVAWGLRKAGYSVVMLEGVGWQPERRASITTGVHGGVLLGGQRIGAGDTIWFRSTSLAWQHPALAQGDEKFSRNEYTAFDATLLLHIEQTGAFCVNKWSAGRRVENKSFQLALAEQAGLLVPPTIMTNSYQEVQRFLQDVDGEVVHKSFRPHAWMNKATRTLYVCETSAFDRNSENDAETFAYAPSIYQKKIAKKFDVRITMMGARLYGFIIEAGRTLDWRMVLANSKGSARQVTVPAEVEASLLRFAARADIVFGCFDMSVDDAGNWWFLEVNQAGHFLFIDDLCPDQGLYVPMLRFLSAREPVAASGNSAAFPSYRQCQSECGFRAHAIPLNDLAHITVEGES